MIAAFEISRKKNLIRELQCTATVLDPLIHSAPVALQASCTPLTGLMEDLACKATASRGQILQHRVVEE